MIGFFKFLLFKYKWRIRNRHNFTKATRMFPMDSVSIGKYTYGGVNVLDFGRHFKLNIGSFCSIGPNVCFILEAEHEMSFVSTYPFKVKLLEQETEAKSKGNITIGDDVWIGYGSIILSGVTIGRGSVVAAGSVVTHDIPPYAIVAGNPAKIIKYRFPDDIVKRLMDIDFNLINKKNCNHYLELLYCSMTDVGLIDKLLIQLKSNS